MGCKMEKEEKELISWILVFPLYKNLVIRLKTYTHLVDYSLLGKFTASEKDLSECKMSLFVNTTMNT